MTNFDEQTDLALLGTQSVTRKWQSNSPRFWLLLTAGSVVLHLLLIHVVGFSRLYAQLNAPQQRNIAPIDFVKLPSSKAASSVASSTEPTIAKSPARSASQPIQTDAVKSAKAVQPIPSSGLSNSSKQSAANSNISVAQSVPAASAVSTPKPTEKPSQPETNISSDTAPETPTVPSPALSADLLNSASQSAQQPSATEQLSESAMTVPTSTPLPSVEPSPLIATMPIDVPVPDVSGTLPPESSPDQLASDPVTDQVPLPSQLTASLTTSSLPTKDTKLLDEVAEPTTEVQTFSANSAVSPCPVTPEVVQFLGETVAMQVATDESGNVVQTVTRESSQSPAYDDLATCLVKNWEFTPAIAQGEPVANDGLVVRITIDRS